MKQARSSGFAGLGMLAIVIALSVVLIAGIVVLRRANEDSARISKHCKEIVCNVP